jgi:hypothetical protein
MGSCAIYGQHFSYIVRRRRSVVKPTVEEIAQPLKNQRPAQGASLPTVAPRPADVLRYFHQIYVGIQWFEVAGKRSSP